VSTTVFGNGRILSMDAWVGEPEVLVVTDGRIVATGDWDLAARYPHAQQIDLAGRWLLPGFIDAHHHLCLAALQPLWADLAGVHDVDEVGRRLREVAVREPDAPWIRACGWDGTPRGLHLDRWVLDELGLDRPVLVACFSLHQAVLSSAGLDALGISYRTRDPGNGRIERDDTGEPTGRLLEGAWGAAHAASMVGYDRARRWGDLIEVRARTLLSYGITAVHDAACPTAAEAVYRQLASEHRLPVSVVVLPHAAEILNGVDAERWFGPVTGEGNEDVRVGPVKFFADGGIEIAIDAHVGAYHVRFGQLFPDTPAGVTEAVARGYGVAIHAMGNAGLVAALDAWESATRHREPDNGLRIEHVTLAGPREVARMAALGVTGVVQPGFVELLGTQLGETRFDDATWMPFGDLHAAGVPLAASSDAPCNFAEPLAGTSYGVSRRTSDGDDVGIDQTIPFEEWLRLYTYGAALAGGQQDERGRLLPGLRADLVVIDGEPDAGRPVGVAQTWRGGELVYERAR
jgi:predicted amidohydrolase YtcJ